MSTATAQQTLQLPFHRLRDHQFRVIHPKPHPPRPYIGRPPGFRVRDDALQLLSLCATHASNLLLARPVDLDPHPPGPRRRPVYWHLAPELRPNQQRPLLFAHTAVAGTRPSRRGRRRGGYWRLREHSAQREVLCREGYGGDPLEGGHCAGEERQTVVRGWRVDGDVERP